MRARQPFFPGPAGFLAGGACALALALVPLVFASLALLATPAEALTWEDPSFGALLDQATLIVRARVAQVDGAVATVVPSQTYKGRAPARVRLFNFTSPTLIRGEHPLESFARGQEYLLFLMPGDPGWARATWPMMAKLPRAERARRLKGVYQLPTPSSGDWRIVGNRCFAGLTVTSFPAEQPSIDFALVERVIQAALLRKAGRAIPAALADGLARVLGEPALKGPRAGVVGPAILGAARLQAGRRLARLAAALVGLRFVARAKDLAAIAARVTHESPLIRRVVMRALGALPRQGARAWLIVGLDDKHSFVQGAAADGLVRQARRDQKARAPVVAALSQALATASTAEGRPLFASEPVQNVTPSALERVIVGLTALAAATARARVLEVFRRKIPERVVAAIIDFCRRFPDDATDAALMQHCARATGATLELVLQYLTARRRPGARAFCERRLRALSGASPERTALIRALGALEDPAAVPVLTALLPRADVGEYDLVAIAFALGRIGDATALPALRRHESRFVGHQHYAYLYALTFIGGASAADELEKQALSERRYQREAALGARIARLLARPKPAAELLALLGERPARPLSGYSYTRVKLALIGRLVRAAEAPGADTAKIVAGLRERCQRDFPKPAPTSTLYLAYLAALDRLQAPLSAAEREALLAGYSPLGG